MFDKRPSSLQLSYATVGTVAAITIGAPLLTQGYLMSREREGTRNSSPLEEGTLPPSDEAVVHTADANFVRSSFTSTNLEKDLHSLGVGATQIPYREVIQTLQAKTGLSTDQLSPILREALRISPNFTDNREIARAWLEVDPESEWATRIVEANLTGVFSAFPKAEEGLLAITYQLPIPEAEAAEVKWFESSVLYQVFTSEDELMYEGWTNVGSVLTQPGEPVTMHVPLFGGAPNSDGTGMVPEGVDLNGCRVLVSNSITTYDNDFDTHGNYYFDRVWEIFDASPEGSETESRFDLVELTADGLPLSHEAKSISQGLQTLHSQVFQNNKNRSETEKKADILNQRLVGRTISSVTTTPWNPNSPEIENAHQEGSLSFYGKVTLVDFWATWCGPCRAGMPHLSQLQAQYAETSSDFQVISLAGPAEEDQLGMEKFVKEHIEKDEPLKNTVGIATQATWDKFQVSSIPQLVLIDKTGTIRWVGLGELPPEDLIEEALAQEVSQGLNWEFLNSLNP